MLIDNHGRHIHYLRMAVTDRCNLRCRYCMPSSGLMWEHRSALLSFEEIKRLLALSSSMGINKLRFTGGEPFMRKDFMQLLRSVMEADLFEKVSITTNGTLTAPHVADLKQMGIHSVNLSVDTFHAKRFKAITRRDDLHQVEETFRLLLLHNIPTRINAIILEGINEVDIVELTGLTKELPVDVRFIEEMPFNGTGEKHVLKWNYVAIVEEIKKHFPSLKKAQDEKGSTSLNYTIDGHRGRVGVIPAYTRSFCGTCNRLRITPIGKLKTCLYDDGALDLRAMLRSGEKDEAIALAIRQAISHRAVDGFEAEALRNNYLVKESMALIGG